RQPWYPVVEHHGAVWTYMGPPDRQPLFPIFSCFENLADDETVVASGSTETAEMVGPALMDHNWYQLFDNATDHYHLPILHNRASGAQLYRREWGPDLPEVEWAYSSTGYSVLTTSRRDLGNGEIYVRIEQMLMPNMLSIPSVLTLSEEAQRIGYVVPCDDTTTMGMLFNIVKVGEDFSFDPTKKKLLGFGPDKKAWNEMTPEEHQLYPGDYEAQRGQGIITFHSEEHLAGSDAGLVKQRRLWKQQAKIVAEGGDPLGVAFKEEDRRVLIETRSWVEKRGEPATAPALA
ncbi:MAG TPA: hypothetical protein VJR88_14515, partial [Novosphingobium sp.]|nr:hypothetical protein [Novosphingobium sp.]